MTRQWEGPAPSASFEPPAALSLLGWKWVRKDAVVSGEQVREKSIDASHRGAEAFAENVRSIVKLANFGKIADTARSKHKVSALNQQ